MFSVRTPVYLRALLLSSQLAEGLRTMPLFRCIDLIYSCGCNIILLFKFHQCTITSSTLFSPCTFSFGAFFFGIWLDFGLIVCFDCILDVVASVYSIDLVLLTYKIYKGVVLFFEIVRCVDIHLIIYRTHHKKEKKLCSLNICLGLFHNSRSMKSTTLEKNK